MYVVQGLFITTLYLQPFFYFSVLWLDLTKLPNLDLMSVCSPRRLRICNIPALSSYVNATIHMNPRPGVRDFEILLFWFLSGDYFYRIFNGCSFKKISIDMSDESTGVSDW